MNTNTENSAAVQGTEVATENQVSKKVAPKKAAPKKSAAKVAPKKSAPTKKSAAPVAKASTKEVLKATSMAEAIKAVKKSDQKLGVISVGGKKYSFTKRSTWCVSKNLLKNGEAGLIMVIAEEGHYVYPANKYKELFGKIMKSKTWSEIGSYSQSVLPQWHAEFFTAIK